MSKLFIYYLLRKKQRKNSICINYNTVYTVASYMIYVDIKTIEYFVKTVATIGSVNRLRIEIIKGLMLFSRLCGSILVSQEHYEKNINTR